MSQRELSVQSRETTGKEAAKKLRRDGRIPAIAYGHQEEPKMLSLNSKQLRDMLAHGGRNGLIKLQFEGGPGADLPVIIKALQKHPVTHAVIAVDFMHVSLTERVKSTVPIVLVGESAGVKVEGGVLVQAMHSIEIEALPQDVPEHIEVDISGLEFNGAPIHVKEITLPAGLTAITDGDESIAVVNPPDVEPIVEAEAEDPAAVEAINQKTEAEDEVDNDAS
jgi:large subunit ribosomal protein L25